MLITLSGVITQKLEQSLVIETGGLGYQLWVTPAEFEKATVNQEGRYWIYESIREDAHDLYGFADYSMRMLFTKLLGVSGVGPKAALAILSLGSFNNISQAIAHGDIALLQTAPGIGKRTAERIVVELKSSLDIELVTGSEGPIDNTVLEALESLGYSRMQAARALSKIPPELEEKERIKRALQEIGND